MNQDQTKALSGELLFMASPLLSLFENDGDHWYDRDDFIGKHTITETPGDSTQIGRASCRKSIYTQYAVSVRITQEPTRQTTAILRVGSITCFEQAETFTDELYVTFN